MHLHNTIGRGLYLAGRQFSRPSPTPAACCPGEVARTCAGRARSHARRRPAAAEVRHDSRQSLRYRSACARGWRSAFTELAFGNERSRLLRHRQRRLENAQTSYSHLDGVSCLSFLIDVACSTARACTATGRYFPETGPSYTYAESWNGKAWALQPTVNPSETINALDGVACMSATACTAVGGYAGPESVSRSLIERYSVGRCQHLRRARRKVVVASWRFADRARRKQRMNPQDSFATCVTSRSSTGLANASAVAL